jgi:hypothetical protein
LTCARRPRHPERTAVVFLFTALFTALFAAAFAVRSRRNGGHPATRSW